MAVFVANAQRLGRSLKLDNIIQHKSPDYVDNRTHVFYAAKRRQKFCVAFIRKSPASPSSV
ncbi:hypothetical protein [Rhizobium anhuiense]|uniref:hypothetical protein n=1 Tax=Rhizobium anhuiense TaxID=1184720 RepID=UPI0020CF709C|nr:hypothetical protein [Rhizobium anhuiense]UTS90236.1 hypothetical protein NE851_27085 [Rhizobium anhuiense bv. trifolii]